MLFGDFEEKYREYANAMFAILPVPYDATSTWVKGADKGPEAFLDASFTLENYDVETKTEAYKHGIATLEPVTEDRTPELWIFSYWIMSSVFSMARTLLTQYS